MKKIITFMTLSFFAFNAFAIDLSKIQIQLDQLSFQNNKGSGLLNNLTLETDVGFKTNTEASTDKAPMKVNLSRKGKTVNINTGVMNISVQNANDLLAKIDVFQLSKLNLMMGLGQHKFNVSSAYIKHQSTGEIHAAGLELECAYKDQGVLDFSKVTDQCLAKSSIHADQLEIPDMNFFFQESFIGLSLEPETEALQTVKDLEMEISKGDFQLSLKVKGIPLVRIKALGNVKADINKRQATIRVDKVKLGLVGVTDIVMNQLKKTLPPENFRVDPPFIYANW